MRICLFTPTFLPRVGGAERDADLIARSLTARGHDVVVLAESSGEPAPPLPYKVSYYRRPIKQHWFIGRVGRALQQLHRRRPFDVVLAFYGYPNGCAAARLKEQLGFTLVVTPRGGDLLANYHALKKPNVRRLIREGYRSADRIVTISGWLGQRLEQVAGPDLPPVELVYNGIDLDAVDADRQAVKTADINLPIDKPFILHLGGVKPVKRQDLAVQAVHLLRDEFEQRGLQYAIVGDGQSMLDIRDLVRRYELGGIVKLLGPRVGLEKAWLLDNALFMVATSREEGLGNVTLEAMACGLPMLGSDIGPHRELIGDLQWGMLFRSGDAEDLAAKIMDMINGDRNTLAQRALQCRGQFTLDAMTHGYEQACRRAFEEVRP